MNTVFDANLLLDAQQTEVNEKRPPLPVENPESNDGLYLAMIGEIKTQQGVIEKGDKTGQLWACMVVPLKVQVPPSLQQGMKLPPEVTITDRPFLDLTPQGGLDNAPGKNRGQRIYRDATELNKPGEPFAWRMLTGRLVKVKLAHEIYNGELQEKVGSILKS